VKAGEVLIVIEDKRVDATVEVLKGQLDAEMAKAARLRAERDMHDSIEFPPELTGQADDPQVADQMASEVTYFETRRGALNQQLTLLEKQMQEAREEIAQLNDRAEAQDAAAKLLAEEVAANEQIEKSQYVSRVHVLELKRGIEDYRARRGEHLADIAQAQQKITDLHLRTVSIKDQYVEAAAEELTASNAKIYDLEERLRPSEDAKLRQQVISPINGTVVDLKVFTIGGTVAPREPLLDIVPDDNPLVVEAEIPVDSIDDVRIGQEAEIRLSAYKRRSTPLVDGSVVYVSADRLTDRTGEKVYYLARVHVDRKSLAEAGNLEMSPGMPAEVFIKTDERTALDYLLAPVTQSLRRSFREP
jgi:HlyD family type I secretion membrane fusion protein